MSEQTRKWAPMTPNDDVVMLRAELQSLREKLRESDAELEKVKRAFEVRLTDSECPICNQCLIDQGSHDPGCAYRKIENCVCEGQQITTSLSESERQKWVTSELQNLQLVKELAQVQAGAAEMRSHVDLAYKQAATGYDSRITKHDIIIREELFKALTSTAGSSLLKEMEELRKMNLIAKHSTMERIDKIEALEAKLEVAVEGLDRLSKLGNGNLLGNSEGNILAQSFLAKINEKGEV